MRKFGLAACGALMLLLGPLAATAQDAVRMEPKVIIDGRANATNRSALSILGNGVPERHPLVLYREDSIWPGNGTWLFKGGGSALTQTSLTIAGEVEFNVDVLTGEVTMINPGGMSDPDFGGGSLPAMLGLGADVHTAFVIRSNYGACNVCPGTGGQADNGPWLAHGDIRKNKAFLLITSDRNGDWGWAVDGHGTHYFGDTGDSLGVQDGTGGENSWDIRLGRLDDGNDGLLVVETDLNGDGNGARQVTISRPHPQCTGSSANGMVMAIGNTGQAAIDTGDEVCNVVPRGGQTTVGSGCSCEMTLDPTDGSEHDCSTPHPATDDTASGMFYAVCH